MILVSGVALPVILSPAGSLSRDLSFPILIREIGVPC